MSNIWKRIKLQNVCERVTVGHVGKTSAYYCDDGVKFLRTQNVGKDGLKLNDVRFITPEFHRSLKKSQLVVGDVLISRVVTDDMRCAIVPPELEPANCANIILLRPGSELNSRYLYHLINSPYAQKYLLDRRVGSAQQVVNTKILKNWEIPVPSLCEQERIVAILDEAFAGIATAVANTEKNLANARELFENYLNGVFSRRGEGWIEKPLKEFSESVSTGPFGSMLHKSDYVTVGVPLVNPVNIVDGTIRPDERKMISSDTRERLQSYILRAGDIVIARRGEIGRCAVVTKEQTGWVCGTGCFFVRPGNTVDPYFLAHMLRSVRYRSELERLSSGATMLNLSNTALSNLRICIPSLAEQRNIIAHMSELLAQCEEVRSIYRNKLHALAELKQSLLQKAFSGELTAIPQDEIETALA